MLNSQFNDFAKCDIDLAPEDMKSAMKESKQLHNRAYFRPMDADELTNEDR